MDSSLWWLGSWLLVPLNLWVHLYFQSKGNEELRNTQWMSPDCFQMDAAWRYSMLSKQLTSKVGPASFKRAGLLTLEKSVRAPVVFSGFLHFTGKCWVHVKSLIQTTINFSPPLPHSHFCLPLTPFSLSFKITVTSCYCASPPYRGKLEGRKQAARELCLDTHSSFRTGSHQEQTSVCVEVILLSSFWYRLLVTAWDWAGPSISAGG